MAAIITNTFKQQIAQSIFDEVYFPTASNTHRYYIGIGKSEQWDSSETVPDPLNSPREIYKSYI
jgi:hypothetical protein